MHQDGREAERWCLVLERADEWLSGAASTENEPKWDRASREIETMSNDSNPLFCCAFGRRTHATLALISAAAGNQLTPLLGRLAAALRATMCERDNKNCLTEFMRSRCPHAARLVTLSLSAGGGLLLSFSALRNSAISLSTALMRASACELAGIDECDLNEGEGNADTARRRKSGVAGDSPSAREVAFLRRVPEWQADLIGACVHGLGGNPSMHASRVLGTPKHLEFLAANRHPKAAKLGEVRETVASDWLRLADSLYTGRCFPTAGVDSAPIAVFDTASRLLLDSDLSSLDADPVTESGALDAIFSARLVFLCQHLLPGCVSSKSDISRALIELCRAYLTTPSFAPVLASLAELPCPKETDEHASVLDGMMSSLQFSDQLLIWRIPSLRSAYRARCTALFDIPRRWLCTKQQSSPSRLATSQSPVDAARGGVSGSQYEVEAVRDVRTTREGNEEFFIKWAGYDETTWEPLANVDGARERLMEFRKAQFHACEEFLPFAINDMNSELAVYLVDVCVLSAEPVLFWHWLATAKGTFHLEQSKERICVGCNGERVGSTAIDLFRITASKFIDSVEARCRGIDPRANSYIGDNRAYLRIWPPSTQLLISGLMTVRTTARQFVATLHADGPSATNAHGLWEVLSTTASHLTAEDNLGCPNRNFLFSLFHEVGKACLEALVAKAFFASPTQPSEGEKHTVVVLTASILTAGVAGATEHDASARWLSRCCSDIIPQIFIPKKRKHPDETPNPARWAADAASEVGPYLAGLTLTIFWRSAAEMQQISSESAKAELLSTGLDFSLVFQLMNALADFARGGSTAAVALLNAIDLATACNQSRLFNASRTGAFHRCCITDGLGVLSPSDTDLVKRCQERWVPGISVVRNRLARQLLIDELPEEPVWGFCVLK